MTRTEALAGDTAQGSKALDNKQFDSATGYAARKVPVSDALQLIGGAR